MVHVVFKHFTDITEIGWMRVTYDDLGDFQGFQVFYRQNFAYSLVPRCT